MQKPTCVVKDCKSPSLARGLCTAHYSRMKRRGTTDAVTPISIEDRFWSKVKKTPTCWEWQSTIVRGYGYFCTSDRGKQTKHRAHRKAYEFLVGPIPEGLDLDHMCHNTSCVNPEHLRPTTRKQNMENRSGPNANSRSGYRGVHWNGGKQKWSVVVGHNGNHHYGGYFTDPHEANLVAQRLRQELFTHSGEGQIA